MSATPTDQPDPDAPGTLDQTAMIGYTARSSDGHDVGEVVEDSIDVGGDLIVVDLGGWLRDQRRLVPAGAIGSVDHDAETVDLTVTKDQVSDAPHFSEDSVIDGRRADHDDLKPLVLPYGAALG